MYPDTFMTFDMIPNSSVDSVRVEMKQLADNIKDIPNQIEIKITKNMYGNMEIKNNQMFIYDTEGTLIQTFNLFDYEGRPTTTSPVYKRELVKKVE